MYACTHIQCHKWHNDTWKGFFDYFIECSEKQAINLIQKLKLYSLRLDVNFKKESLFVVVSNFLPKNIDSKKDIRFSHDEIYRSYLISNEKKDINVVNYTSDTNWYNHLRFLNCCPEGEIEIPSNFLTQIPIQFSIGTPTGIHAEFPIEFLGGVPLTSSWGISVWLSRIHG